jgi:Holliday junction resolvase RusA-like endonuclease
MMLFSCKIMGRVISKKNSKRIYRNRHTGKPFIVSSLKHETWEKSAVLAVRNSWRGDEPISKALEATYRFYFKNRQGEPDTSNCIEAPQDVLKKAGVITDDKIIKRVIAEKFFGEEPRTEIELKAI